MRADREPPKGQTRAVGGDGAAASAAPGKTTLSQRIELDASEWSASARGAGGLKGARGPAHNGAAEGAGSASASGGVRIQRLFGRPDGWDGSVSRKARDSNGVAAGADDAVAGAASSGGSALPGALRPKFESSLGADLSAVRVHTGAASAAAADAVGARAYTVGQDIHFGAGKYDPSTSRGEHPPPSSSAGLEASRAALPRVGTAAVQMRAEASAPKRDAVHRAAARGTQGIGERLPFLDLIQRAFGRHDVSRVQAYMGPEVAAATRAMGARAFATGDHVAFAGTPDLHTAAHEAAHVVQQRVGVTLTGDVGRAGDPYERHANAVADEVVAGRSAEGLLDAHAGGAGTGAAVVQRKPSDVRAFKIEKRGTLSTLGAQLTEDLNMAALFAQVFPGKRIDLLPAAVGITGILSLEGADTETTMRVTWTGEDQRCEIYLDHDYFFHFLNELRWDHDSAEPTPSLFLHKWELIPTHGGKGAGLAVFRSMHRAATDLGMIAIMADAIGDLHDPLKSEPENGYYTWIRFGFNKEVLTPGDDDDLFKFNERINALELRLQSLPEERAVLARLKDALPQGSTVRDLPDGEDEQKWLELHNQQADPSRFSFSTDQQAELSYLTKWREVQPIEHERERYGAPLEWYKAHRHEIHDLNDLFLRPPDQPTRVLMATLWRGYGSSVIRAKFDLAPDGRSNQVLKTYLADRGLK